MKSRCRRGLPVRPPTSQLSRRNDCYVTRKHALRDHAPCPRPPPRVVHHLPHLVIQTKNHGEMAAMNLKFTTTPSADSGTYRLLELPPDLCKLIESTAEGDAGCVYVCSKPYSNSSVDLVLSLKVNRMKMLSSARETKPTLYVPSSSQTRCWLSHHHERTPQEKSTAMLSYETQSMKYWS